MIDKISLMNALMQRRSISAGIFTSATVTVSFAEAGASFPSAELVKLERLPNVTSVEALSRSPGR
jgi:hypothetical protein